VCVQGLLSYSVHRYVCVCVKERQCVCRSVRVCVRSFCVPDMGICVCVFVRESVFVCKSMCAVF